MKIDKPDPVNVQEEPLGSPTTTRPFPRPFFILLVALGVIAVLSLSVYFLPLTHPVTRAITSVLPFPAAMVNGSIITIHSYNQERDALSQYVETTGGEKPASEEMVRQTILDALMNKAAIRAVAARAHVKIDQTRVEQYYQEVLSGEESEEAFENEIEKTFGWNKREFKKRIIESIVLALQMSEFVLSDDSFQTEARAQIEFVRDHFTESEQVVDLGYQPVSSLPTAWASVGSLPAGGRTDILESEDGFAVIEVVERIEASEDTQLHLRGAMIRKKTLENVVREYLDEAEARVFIR